MTEKWSTDQYKAYMASGKFPEKNKHVDATYCKHGKTKSLNNTEKEYLAMLQVRVKEGTLSRVMEHESFGFKIGEPRCVYWPDFVAVRPDEKIEIHEIKVRKGKWTSARDDAKVKFKTARMLFPEFEWFWMVKDVQQNIWRQEM